MREKNNAKRSGRAHRDKKKGSIKNIRESRAISIGRGEIASAGRFHTVICFDRYRGVRNMYIETRKATTDDDFLRILIRASMERNSLSPLCIFFPLLLHRSRRAAHPASLHFFRLCTLTSALCVRIAGNKFDNLHLEITARDAKCFASSTS